MVEDRTTPGAAREQTTAAAPRAPGPGALVVIAGDAPLERQRALAEQVSGAAGVEAIVAAPGDDEMLPRLIEDAQPLALLFFDRAPAAPRFGSLADALAGRGLAVPLILIADNAGALDAAHAAAAAAIFEEPFDGELPPKRLEEIVAGLAAAVAEHAPAFDGRAPGPALGDDVRTARSARNTADGANAIVGSSRASAAVAGTSTGASTDSAGASTTGADAGVVDVLDGAAGVAAERGERAAADDDDDRDGGGGGDRERGRGRGRGREVLLGESPAIERVREALRRLEDVAVPAVLLYGEVGTGKSAVARVIHERGPRRAAPFIDVDCAAFSDALFETELFGRERARARSPRATATAATAAAASQPGVLELVGAGVVFLDEVGALPLAIQGKLARALDNRRFRRGGGVAELPLTALLIASSSRDLSEEVNAGRFRQELHYRLSAVAIELPPLRRRVEDIEAIAHAIAGSVARELERPVPTLTAGLVQSLQRYPWPGNIRELGNVIERMLVMRPATVTLTPEDLPPGIMPRSPRATTAPSYVLAPTGIDLGLVERSFVEQALELTDGNQTHAAKLLGISRFALRHRIDRYGLHDWLKQRAEPHGDGHRGDGDDGDGGGGDDGGNAGDGEDDRGGRTKRRPKARRRAR